MARHLRSAAGLEALAAELSLLAMPGAAILLDGPLGAGKSTFARAVIRALAPAGSEFDIPSPTFTLIQTYGETRIPVAHADLYRIAQSSELDELGLDELVKSHVLLIEWPDRLASVPWPDVLRVSIAGHGASRSLTLAGEGRWAEALRRNETISRFIAGTNWRNARRRFLEGDASFRRYETLDGDGPPVILMDMPARADGPPVRNGKPYSAIAHLAEDMRAVIAVNAELVGRGYSAPVTHAVDIGAGLAIIEDLGRRVYGRMLLAGEDMREPLRAAVEVLASMAAQSWPAQVPVNGGAIHVVPPYDREAQLIEADLLPSWFWPYRHGIAVPPGLREEFAGEWSRVLGLADAAQPVWTLRDFHSPNLLWLPERGGAKRVGLIDTQDCLLGHPAYDLASLLQDARVDIDFAMADELFGHYCRLRSGPGFKPADFAGAFAILGAQRAAKILGIFARLSKRDGKHRYLQHLPRVSRSLERNLQHPVMTGLKKWFDRHLPAAVREGRA